MLSPKPHQCQPQPQMQTHPNIENTTCQESDDEDTLSLSNLPIHRSNSTTDHDQNQDFWNTSSPQDQDFFEFFTEDWKNGNNTEPNSIFVSNPSMIPKTTMHFEKKQPSLGKPMSKSKSQENPDTQKSSDSIFLKSKSTSYNSSSKSSSATGKYFGDKVDVLVKGKWLFVLLGLPPKIPTDNVKLRNDIKLRQSRHAPSTFFPSKNGGDSGSEEVVATHLRSEKGLWKLSKAASCFGGLANIKKHNLDF